MVRHEQKPPHHTARDIIKQRRHKAYANNAQRDRGIEGYLKFTFHDNTNLSF
jgi:hypothetical protein